MLDEAFRTGQIVFNPAALCKLPQGANHEGLPLRRGQPERYLKAAEERNALPLNERAVNLLTKELQRHPSHPEVFLNPKAGAPYRLHEFYYLHRQVLRAAGLPWIAFSDLAWQCKEVGL